MLDSEKSKNLKKWSRRKNVKNRSAPWLFALTDLISSNFWIFLADRPEGYPLPPLPNLIIFPDQGGGYRVGIRGCICHEKCMFYRERTFVSVENAILDLKDSLSQMYHCCICEIVNLNMCKNVVLCVNMFFPEKRTRFEETCRKWHSTMHNALKLLRRSFGIWDLQKNVLSNKEEK